MKNVFIYFNINFVNTAQVLHKSLEHREKTRAMVFGLSLTLDFDKKKLRSDGLRLQLCSWIISHHSNQCPYFSDFEEFNAGAPQGLAFVHTLFLYDINNLVPSISIFIPVMVMIISFILVSFLRYNHHQLN